MIKRSDKVNDVMDPWWRAGVGSAERRARTIAYRLYVDGLIPKLQNTPRQATEVIKGLLEERPAFMDHLLESVKENDRASQAGSVDSRQREPEGDS